MMLGLDFNGALFVASLVSGVSSAVYYALTAVPIVLSYRISRTVAFFNGGLLVMGGLVYYWLSFDAPNIRQPDIPGAPALLIVAVLGALVGLVYGLIVTGRRVQSMPPITTTTFSLGVALLLAGLASMLPGAFLSVPSLLGDGTFIIAGGVYSHHQAYVTAFLVVLVVVLAVVLARTRIGIYIRAIADSPEASKLVGVPMRSVATGVYVLSGTLAALAGALVTPDFSPETYSLLFVFLRGITVGVLGGFRSLPLALVGALLFGVSDSVMRAGVLGDFSGGQREVVAVGMLLVLVLYVNRFMASRGKEMLSEQGL